MRYVAPPDANAARELVKGVMRYFDYGNHRYVRTIVGMYFQNAYPFEPHLRAIFSELDDIRTMRNASAHITSTTRSALDGLIVRLFGNPRPGLSLYHTLTATNPKSTSRETIFGSYKAKLLVAAELIVQG